MVKDYVLVLVVAAAGRGEEVLLVLKDRPDWQKGRLNLPGGKVEDGETPEQAAIRELKEETGLDAIWVRPKGVMKDRDFTIHCFDCHCNPRKDWLLKPRPGETEEPLFLNVEAAYKDARLMPNLRVIIPLMRSAQSGWVIEDHASSIAGPTHTIAVSVPTHRTPVPPAEPKEDVLSQVP